MNARINIDMARKEYSRRIFHEAGEGTLTWAILCFRIFSNYFSQKFEKN